MAIALPRYEFAWTNGGALRAAMRRRNVSCPPARTAVAVNGLALGARVEIGCIAAP